MNVGYVFGGQQQTGVHDDIDVWLRSENRGCWDRTKGVSYINGSNFYNHVLIPDEDDFLVFLIKFAGKVSRGGLA